MDLFVVPTIGFDLLYAFVIVRLDRRDLVWINVTANPTAEWVDARSPRHFLEMGLRVIWSGTAIGSKAPLSHADCAPWASERAWPLLSERRRKKPKNGGGHPDSSEAGIPNLQEPHTCQMY
jgi:hypothetical protein